jgi:hypothetical protein
MTSEKPAAAGGVPPETPPQAAGVGALTSLTSLTRLTSLTSRKHAAVGGVFPRIHRQSALLHMVPM